MLSVVVSGLSYWSDTDLIQTTNCDTNQCLSTRNSSYWSQLRICVKVSGFCYQFVSKLLVLSTGLGVIYRVVGPAQLFDPDLPVAFLSQQLVDLIVQVPNPELTKAGCTQTSKRGQREGRARGQRYDEMMSSCGRLTVLDLSHFLRDLTDDLKPTQTHRVFESNISSVHFPRFITPRRAQASGGVPVVSTSQLWGVRCTRTPGRVSAPADRRSEGHTD